MYTYKYQNDAVLCISVRFDLFVQFSLKKTEY